MSLNLIMQQFFRQYFKLQLSENHAISKMQRGYAFVLILCVALVVVTISILNINSLENSRASTWKSAEDSTPQPLLKKILSQDSIRHINISLIKVMQVPSQGTGNLYIFDFRSPQLCGTGGCFYSVYNESGKPLLKLIANSHLPPKENLIQVSNTVRQGFPCLVITQNTAMENMVSRTQYCYQDREYVRFNQALTAVGTNFKLEE
jgi:hypothetical protein